MMYKKLFRSQFPKNIIILFFILFYSLFNNSICLSNSLVQNNNLSFREAYKISGKLVNYAEKKNKKLNELKFDEIKKIKNNLNKKVMKVFDVKNSVNSKSSYGGTSVKNIKSMITKYKKEFK